MASTPLPLSTEKLDALLDEWEEARERGEERSLSSVCGGCPDLTRALRERIERLAQLDWMDDIPDTDEDCGCPGGGTLKPCGQFDQQVPPVLADRYQLESLIAEGGFGQVWRAADTILERPVAVKVTCVDCLGEARRVARLKHHGIVSVHDVGHHEGYCFIVFDLIEGNDLWERLRQGPLDWPVAVRLVADVAEYVAYAHERGFVHRDIKPANILLDEKDRPILADFGIAVARGDLAKETATTVGTLAYMAPEQLQPEATIDHRVDIHALGVVLFEACAGVSPFAARHLWEARERILKEPAPSLSEAAPGVPAALSVVCARALAKQPSDRFQTASEFAVALRAIVPPETATST